MEKENEKQSFLDRLSQRFFSKKAWTVFLILSLTLGVITGTLLGLFTVSSLHNDILLGKESTSLRKEILSQGERPTDEIYSASQIFIRAVDLYGKSVSDEERSYCLAVVSEDVAADYFCYASTYALGEYRAEVCFETCFAFDLDSPQRYGVTISSCLTRFDEALVYDKYGHPHDGFLFASSFDYDHLEFPFQQMIGACYGAFEEPLNTELETTARNAFMLHFNSMDTMFPKFGIQNHRSMWETKAQEKWTIINMANIGKCFVYAAIAGAVFFGLFILASLQFILAKKREARGLVLAMEETPPVVEAPIETKSSKPMELIKKIKIKPVFHEWVYRLIGLALMLSCAIYLGVLRIGSARGWWGEAPTGEFWGNAFESIYSLGSLLLVIIVAVVIAESHHKLFRTTLLFFFCGFVFYVAISSMLFSIDSLFVGENGQILTYIMRFELPGNVFFGCGIFCFVGFFLFENPGEDIIKRPVFRLLSLIPVAMAIVSIIISIEMQVGHVEMHYAISNLFFIKDPKFLLVGIGMEYVIFFMRRHCERRYGKDALAVERRPEMQMLKNLALCGLVLTLSLLSYAFPLEMRYEMGFSCLYSIGFLAVPLLLFLKPSAEKHNFTLDWLYYLLFFVTLAMPTIIYYADMLFAR